MRKLRRRRKSIQFKRKKKQLRETMRLRKVLTGLESNLTITDIHHATGMSQKSIRKIMMSHPSEITFLMLQRQLDNKKKKK